MHELTQAAVQFGLTQVREAESRAADLILHTLWAIFCPSRAMTRQGPNIRKGLPSNVFPFVQGLTRARRSGAQARAVQSISDYQSVTASPLAREAPTVIKEKWRGDLGGGGV